MSSNQMNYSVNQLAQAIYTVNRHAKTALDSKYLYTLKKVSLDKMLKENKAVKKGLHFSRNPRFSQQQSDVLIECGAYTFHMPPTKHDFETLPHLGKLNENIRNPKTRMSLHVAKQILQNYTNFKENAKSQQTKQPVVFKRLGDSY